MVMIKLENIAQVLSEKTGFKQCVGLSGKKCFRGRRPKGRLCVECHRIYMKEFMARKRWSKNTSKTFGTSESSNRSAVVDGYDFRQ